MKGTETFAPIELGKGYVLKVAGVGAELPRGTVIIDKHIDDNYAKSYLFVLIEKDEWEKIKERTIL